MTLRRWLALCGVGAALLVPTAVLLGRIGSLEEHASAAKVVSFYRDHTTGNRVSAVMVAIAAVSLIFFAARLREVLRGSDTGEGALPLAAFGGAVLASAGLSLVAVVQLALVEAADRRLATAAQTLNELIQSAFGVAIFGCEALFLAAGIATVRYPVLPRWLGWVAIVLGILSLSGPLSSPGFLVGLLWILVVGIKLLVRNDLSVAPGETNSGST